MNTKAVHMKVTNVPQLQKTGASKQIFSITIFITSKTSWVNKMVATLQHVCIDKSYHTSQVTFSDHTGKSNRICPYRSNIKIP